MDESSSSSSAPSQSNIRGGRGGGRGRGRGRRGGGAGASRSTPQNPSSSSSSASAESKAAALNVHASPFVPTSSPSPAVEPTASSLSSFRTSSPSTGNHNNNNNNPSHSSYNEQPSARPRKPRHRQNKNNNNNDDDDASSSQPSQSLPQQQQQQQQRPPRQPRKKNNPSAPPSSSSSASAGAGSKLSALSMAAHGAGVPLSSDRKELNQEDPSSWDSASVSSSATWRTDQSDEKHQRGAGAGGTSRRGGGRKSQQQRRQPRGQHQVGAHSTLAQEITTRLQADDYECSICTERVGRRGKIWSCDRCFIIIHLSCIQKWAQAKTDILSKTFLCPGCALEVKEAPNSYYCYCKKHIDPPFNAFLTPHSCGDVCGRQRDGGCPHACNLPCHPGSCPPCSAMAPLTTCPCGSTTYRLRCGEMEKQRRTCENPCNKTLSCGNHKCSKMCHDGPCGACSEVEEQTCFCERVSQPRPCGSGSRHIRNEEAVSAFSCGNVCDKLLECGNHRCKRVCHPEDCTECDRLPANPQRCACGATYFPLDECKVLRKNCLSALPECHEVCGRLLDCGLHSCSRKCHDSPCDPCQESVEERCRCGKAKMKVSCQKRQDMLKNRPADEKGAPLFLCETVCKKRLLCGHHRCNRKCCPASFVDELAPLAHRCEKVCDQPLACGRHNCSEFCHLGYCPPCSVTFREGVSCPCGHTRVPGPLKCSSVPVSSIVCREPCSKVKPCGHPCKYTCHQGDCGTCVSLVPKKCAGGHIELAAVPCNVAAPSCGRPCAKPMPCGMHKCTKFCHSGPCVSGPRSSQAFMKPQVSAEQKRESEWKAPVEMQPCGQPCHLPRRECAHLCQALCHVGQMCPEVKCNQPVTVTCACKRISKKVICGRGGKVEDGIAESTIPVHCDDLCEQEQRNARFRQALDISGKDGPYIPYPEALIQKVLTEGLKAFAKRVEKTFDELLTGTRKHEKVFNFPPMPENQRWLIHQMATLYSFQSESLDRGEQRSVRIVKMPNSRFPPMLLTDALTLYTQNPHNSRTVEEERMLHFFRLNQGFEVSDMLTLLHPWSQHCHVHWLDRTHAVVVFADPSIMEQAKKSISQVKVFQLRAMDDDPTQTAFYLTSSPPPPAPRTLTKPGSPPSSTFGPETTAPSLAPTKVRDAWDDASSVSSGVTEPDKLDDAEAEGEFFVPTSRRRGAGSSNAWARGGSVAAAAAAAKNVVVVGRPSASSSSSSASDSFNHSGNKWSALDASLLSRNNNNTNSAQRGVGPSSWRRDGASSTPSAAPVTSGVESRPVEERKTTTAMDRTSPVLAPLSSSPFAALAAVAVADPSATAVDDDPESSADVVVVDSVPSAASPPLPAPSPIADESKDEGDDVDTWEILAKE